MAIDATIPLRSVVPDRPDSLGNAFNMAKLSYLPKQMEQETKVNELKLKTAELEGLKTKNDLMIKLLGSATDQGSYDAARKTAAEYGIDVKAAPEVYDPSFVNTIMMSSLDAKDRLDLAMKKSDSEFERDKFAETMRHNKATEGVAQQNADMRNSLADLKLKMAESGQLGLKDRVQVEKTLRDDFQTQSKDWNTVANFYQRGLEGAKAANSGNPQGDQTLIYSFMKLQDPTSVVMPGEYATAGSFRGVPEGLIQQYNKAIKGDSLSPQQRANISQQMEAMFRQKANQQVKNETSYRDLAARSSVDPSNVMIGVPSVTQISPTWPTQNPRLAPPPMKGTKDSTPTTPKKELLPPPSFTEENAKRLMELEEKARQ